jgi:hypothetical protein
MNRLVFRICSTALLFSLSVLSGCRMLHSTGLDGTIGPSGVSGTTSIIVEESAVSLTLSGSYDIAEGSLTVVVEGPDGKHAYEYSFTAPAAGSIEQALTAVAGRWVLSVTGPAGSGSYEVRLDYWSTGGSL